MVKRHSPRNQARIPGHCPRDRQPEMPMRERVTQLLRLDKTARQRLLVLVDGMIEVERTRRRMQVALVLQARGRAIGNGKLPTANCQRRKASKSTNPRLCKHWLWK